MKSVPIVERQTSLVKSVEEIARSRRLGQRLQQEMEEHLNTLRSAITALEKLHEILDLVDIDSELGGRKQNLAYWLDLQPGRYARSLLGSNTSGDDQASRSKVLETLVQEKSVTLNALYKASLEFTSVTVFSPSELKFAKEIGDTFAHVKRSWEQFKRCHSNRQPLHFKLYSFRPIRDFLELLVRNGVIKSYAFSVKNGRGEPDQPVDAATLERASNKKPLDRETNFNATYDGLDSKQLSLVIGGWFEVFTYLEFRGMLSRLASEYEIYSRVEFEATEPLKGKVRSDFDILVGLPDQIMLAECKSGAIDREIAYQMIENSRRLRRIFERMGVNKYLFLLVFSPSDDANKNLGLDDLLGAAFKILEPHNVAPFLNAYIQNQEPPVSLTWSPTNTARAR